MKLIEDEALIEELKSYQDEYKYSEDPYKRGRYDAYETAIDTIKEYSNCESKISEEDFLKILDTFIKQNEKEVDRLKIEREKDVRKLIDYFAYARMLMHSIILKSNILRSLTDLKKYKEIKEND